MRHWFFLAAALVFTVINTAFGDEMPCADVDMYRVLTSTPPINNISIDFSAIDNRLKQLQQSDASDRITSGVSMPVSGVNFAVRRRDAPTPQVKKVKTGLIARCGKSIVFMTSLGLPDDRFYTIVVSLSSGGIVTFNNSGPVSRSIPTPDGKVFAASEKFQGPRAVLKVQLPPGVNAADISIHDVIPEFWPADSQELFPTKWAPSTSFLPKDPSATNGSTFDVARKSLGPFKNSETLPNDFLDYGCMSDARAFGRFPPNLRESVRAVGLLRIIYLTTIANVTYFAEGYCTGTLVNIKRNNTTHVLTANHCFVGDLARNATNGDFLTATMYWDYRNQSCTNGPPARWSQAQILALPSSAVATISASTFVTDAALLDLVTLPSGRTPLAAGGSPDFTNDDVMRMRFHHADVRPLLGSQPFWDWRSEPNFPIPGYQGACEGSRPRENYYYSMWITHAKSSAMYKGASGSSVIAQTGQVVGQLWGWCYGSMRNPGSAPWNYDVDGKIERTLDLLGIR